MSRNIRKHARAKGFTLIELIVVVAIIGVLLGVSIPTISGYMRRSRLKTANANSKLIFNSIQTICQELEFAERDDAVTTFYGSEQLLDSSGAPVMKNGNLVMTGITDGALVIYSIDGAASVEVWQDEDEDGVVETKEDSAFNTALANVLNDDSTRSSFMNRMDRLYASNLETTWVAYISGFQVQAVLCADTPGTGYVGSFPGGTTETFRHVTEDVDLDNNGISDIGRFDSLAELMSVSTSGADTAFGANAFQNIRTAFVTSAWD